MFVVICSIELYLPWSRSLKEKRQVVKSILERIKSRTNSSAAEVGCQDNWQRAEIGVCMVSASKVLLEKEINLVRKIVDDNAEVEQASFQVEYV